MQISQLFPQFSLWLLFFFNPGSISSSQLEQVRPEGILTMSGSIFSRHNLGRGLLLASSGQKPGTLVNNLQGIGQLPPQQRIMKPQMS